jgi:MYXO-CTERM domain-containing protein
MASMVAACGAPGGWGDATSQTEQPYASAVATLMNFEFDGELVTTSTQTTARSAPTVIRRQLYYTIGQLNGSRGVGRLDRLALSDITTELDENRNLHIRYHAKLPVSWGSKSNLPSSYSFLLPRSMDSEFMSGFLERYSTTCVSSDAHDVSTGSLWYYYRPAARTCQLAEADVIRLEATATRSDENTTGRYPEYHMLWEDRVLNVVAIFGKYEDGATAANDAGISAYNAFVRRLRSTFPQATTEPATLPSAVGVDEPDVSFRAALNGGLEVQINALLVDNVRTSDRQFNDRYNALSTEADLIAYNGHAGLGDNVAALTRKGRFRPGKYQIFFINGCDTFAYVDGSLAEARARLNPDDPAGTKYMEIISNSMPSYFNANATADMALINGLRNVTSPQTYEAMFRGIDQQQIVVVTGEEDNVFTPNTDAGNWPPPPPVPPPADDVDSGTGVPPVDPPGTPPPGDPPPGTDPPPSDGDDAGTVPPAPDAGDDTGLPPDRRGCSCTLGASSEPGPRGGALTLLIGALAVLRLRRRRS